MYTCIDRPSWRAMLCVLGPDEGLLAKVFQSPSHPRSQWRDYSRLSHKKAKAWEENVKNHEEFQLLPDGFFVAGSCIFFPFLVTEEVSEVIEYLPIVWSTWKTRSESYLGLQLCRPSLSNTWKVIPSRTKQSSLWRVWTSGSQVTGSSILPTATLPFVCSADVC